MSNELVQLCAACGLEDTAVVYFKDKGFKSVGQLSKAAVTEEDFLVGVLKPFQDGCKIKGADHKNEEDEIPTKSAFAYLLEKATAEREKAAAAVAPLPVVPGLTAAAGSAHGLNREAAQQKLAKEGGRATACTAPVALSTPIRAAPFLDSG